MFETNFLSTSIQQRYRILLKSVLNTDFILCYFSYHIYYFPLFYQQVLNIHWVPDLFKMQGQIKPEQFPISGSSNSFYVFPEP